jgi:Ca2+-binding EF-hand superfamily protein
MDLNKDGYVSKQEMARFVRNYMNPSKIVDQIEEMTIKLFMKYDVNRSGFLDKREALVMLDELLMSQGK